jgi:hypothetical protein
MSTQAFAPYDYRKAENAEVGKTYNIRMQESLQNFWQRNDPITPPYGKELYWVRLVVASNWLDTAWEKRIPITVPSAQVSTGVQSNFPVYIDFNQLVDADFWANVNVNGDDIRITDSTGRNLLPQELVFFDQTLEIGEMYFNSSTLSNAVDNIFYLYYQNPAAGPVNPLSPNGQYQVWKDYDAVYHFQDGPNLWSDSTVNQNDLVTDTPGSMLVRNDANLFSQSCQTNGTSSAGATFPDLDIFKNPGFTLIYESYVTLNALESGKVLSLGNNNSLTNKTDYFGYNVQSSANVQYSVNESVYNGLSATPINDGNMHQMVMYATQQFGIDEFYTWLDGVSNGVGDITLPITASNAPPKLANRGQWGGAFWWPANSGIDEVRLARVERTGGWFPTHWNNMNTPNAFTVFSAFETPATAGGSEPITTTPRYDQIKLIGSCTLINPDGFIEYFGEARLVEESRMSTAAFSDTAGARKAPVGGEVWLSTDFGVVAPFRFAPSVSSLVTEATVFSNDVDTSCEGRYLIHVVIRGSASAGDILWRVVAAVGDSDTVYAETEGAAPANPTIFEDFVVQTVPPNSEGKDLTVSGTLDLPERVNSQAIPQIFWVTLERVGTSSLDTFAGNADLISARSFTIRWRGGAHVSI